MMVPPPGIEPVAFRFLGGSDSDELTGQRTAWGVLSLLLHISAKFFCWHICRGSGHGLNRPYFAVSWWWPGGPHVARRSVYYDSRGALNFYPLLHWFYTIFYLKNSLRKTNRWDRNYCDNRAMWSKPDPQEKSVLRVWQAIQSQQL